MVLIQDRQNEGSTVATLAQGLVTAFAKMTDPSGTWATAQGSMVSRTPVYDASGNMTSDNVNQYAYDADGHVCAVASPGALGGTLLTGYIYNPAGQRVAKGTINYVTVSGVQTLSCNTALNGFVAFIAALSR